jgi:fucose permease
MVVSTLLCLYATFVFAVDAQVYPSVLTSIVQSPVQQGFLLSSLFLFFPLSSILSGAVSDRVGKKTVLIVAGLFLAIPFATTAWVDPFWIRVLAVLFFGFGIGALESQTSAFLADTHPGRERSIINIAQASFSLGAAGGPFLIAMAFRFNPELEVNALLWTVVAGTLTMVLGFFFLRDGHTAAVRSRGGFKRVLSDPMGRLLLIAMFLYAASEMGTAGWLPTYAEVHLSLSSGSAPLSLTLFWAGLGFSRVLVGFLLHDVRDTRLLKTVLFATLLARILAFTLNRSVASMVLFFVIGAGMGAVWPTFVAMIGRRFKQNSGSAIGLIVGTGGFAVPVMHQTIGLLSREQVLGLRYTLLGLGILTLSNLILVFFIERLENRGDRNSV